MGKFFCATALVLVIVLLTFHKRKERAKERQQRGRHVRIFSPDTDPFEERLELYLSDTTEDKKHTE